VSVASAQVTIKNSSTSVKTKTNTVQVRAYTKNVDGSVTLNKISYIDKTITNPTSNDEYFLHKFYQGATINKATAINIDGTSVAYVLEECTNADPSSCSTVVTGTSSIAGADGTIDDSALAVNSWLKLDTGTITGAVTSWTLTIVYTE
jgi:hypothetical protein